MLQLIFILSIFNNIFPIDAYYVPANGEDWTILKPDCQKLQGSFESLPFTFGIVVNPYVINDEGDYEEPVVSKIERTITTSFVTSVVTAAPKPTKTRDIIVQIHDGQVQKLLLVMIGKMKKNIKIGMMITIMIGKMMINIIPITIKVMMMITINIIKIKIMMIMTSIMMISITKTSSMTMIKMIIINIVRVMSMMFLWIQLLKEEREITKKQENRLKNWQMMKLKDKVSKLLKKFTKILEKIMDTKRSRI